LADAEQRYEVCMDGRADPLIVAVQDRRGAVGEEGPDEDEAVGRAAGPLGRAERAGTEDQRLAGRHQDAVPGQGPRQRLGPVTEGHHRRRAVGDRPDRSRRGRHLAGEQVGSDGSGCGEDDGVGGRGGSVGEPDAGARPVAVQGDDARSQPDLGVRRGRDRAGESLDKAAEAARQAAER
jgi:hypothetical protein